MITAQVSWTFNKVFYIQISCIELFQIYPLCLFNNLEGHGLFVCMYTHTHIDIKTTQKNKTMQQNVVSTSDDGIYGDFKL